MSSVDNRVGSTGTDVRVELSNSFRQIGHFADSFVIENDARLRVGSFRDDGVATTADVSGTSISIVDTTTDQALTGEEQLFIERYAYEDEDPMNLLPPLVSSLKIVDETVGDVLFVEELSSVSQLFEYESLPFHDRIGNQLRIEFMTNGGFSGIPPANNSSGTGSTHPTAGVRWRVSLAVGVPEPSSRVTSVLGVLGTIGIFRRHRKT